MNERVSIGGAHLAAGQRHHRRGGTLWEQRADKPYPAAIALQTASIAALDRGRGAPPHQHPRRPARARSARPGPRARSASCSPPSSTRSIYELAIDLMGAEGMLYGTTRWSARERQWPSGDRQQGVPASRANSIEGGTSEVMRNILGERVLGLPGDVRVDKDLPWSQVPR